jgi:hypothetical protein
MPNSAILGLPQRLLADLPEIIQVLGIKTFIRKEHSTQRETHSEDPPDFHGVLPPNTDLRGKAAQKSCVATF